MHTEILDLVEWDVLVFTARGVGRGVVLGISAECTDVDLARRNGAVRFYDDGNERVLELLVLHLRVHVDPGQPAAVARVRVVPADRVL